MSSSFGSSEPLSSSHSNSRVPSHLYKRQGLYYFRVVISDKLKQRLNRSEFRISLQTAYRQVAKQLAHKLYFYLTTLLEDVHMLDYTEIKRRMNQYLRKLLEQDHNDLNPRTRYDWPEFDINLSSGEMDHRQADIITSALNNPERLRSLANTILPGMIQEGVLTKEEINEDNYLAITKAYLQMQITYHQLVEKRGKGDFLAEEPVFAFASNAIPLSQPQMPSPATNAGFHKPGALLYSDTLIKYIEAKVKDESWKAHSVADHRNRLEAFLEIMGDMPIDKITREHMRKFRDTLRKLPPNRNRTAM